MRAERENFPVASRLLPSGVRRHLFALYGFARLVDDVGDEAAGDRSAQLDWLEADLVAAAAGAATHPVLGELAPTLHELDLPLEPFKALIEANRRDQRVTRYQTFDELLGYCELSANPIGRLVLVVLGEDSEERRRWSDQVCTALQVTEHLQDVGEDARRGRVYLPLEDLARFGCEEADLLAPSAGDALRAVVAFEAARVRGLLEAGGLPLVASLRGRPRLAVAGFVAGGAAALGAIERARFDVLGRDARPRRTRFSRELLGVLRRARAHSRGGGPR